MIDGIVVEDSYCIVYCGMHMFSSILQELLPLWLEVGVPRTDRTERGILNLVTHSIHHLIFTFDMWTRA